LLPDLKDLNYPPDLATIVIDLNKVIVKMEHDNHNGWRAVKRPGAARFFRELMSLYEIVVWSDDNFPVAQDVCAKWGIPVMGTLHRDHCRKNGRHWIKDVGRLGRRLERVVMIDHEDTVFGDHRENGILIRPFEGRPDDRELMFLLDFLKEGASPGVDLREMIRQHGGGDVDLGRRYCDAINHKNDNVHQKRAFGRMLGLDSVVRGGFLQPSRFQNLKH